VSRVAGILSIVRLEAGDVATTGGRSHERFRRAGLTAAAALTAKMVGVVAMLITVPLTLNYLGSERFGLWMTISSISLLLAFSDLGIGNGVLNVTADAYGRDDRRLGREAASSGFFLLSVIAVGLVAVFAISYTFLPWARIFNVTSAEAMSEAGPATAVFILVWALNVPLDVVQRVQLGYQRGFINYAWQAAGSCFGLAGAVAAVKTSAGLPWLVLALIGGPLLAVALNGVVEFGWARPWLRPAWSAVSRVAVKRILHLGVWFFVIQLAVALGFASANLVIAQVLGSSEVTQYAVPARLFALIGVLVSLVFAPLWPAYGEALARGDTDWVTVTLVRSLGLTFVLVLVPSAVLIVFGRPIIHFWVGDDVQPSPWLLAGLGVWTLVSSLGATVSVFLNGVSVLRFQAVCAILMATTALGLEVAFARLWGVSGVPWAVVLAYVVFSAIPMAVYVPRLMRRLTFVTGEGSTAVTRSVVGDPDD
jgi:O-antigen/teichoic acid export membrane protein